MITLQQAKELSHGTILYHDTNKNANRISIPICYDYITEEALCIVSLEELPMMLREQAI